MRTKRQPTIKTFLLFMLTNAILFAAIAVPIREKIGEDWQFALIVGAMSLMQMVAWSILPLIISMLVASYRRLTGVCFAYGFLVVLFHSVVKSFIDLDHITSPFMQGCVVIGTGIMLSPMASLMPLINWLKLYFEEGVPFFLQWSIDFLWLVAYTLNCFLIAKSCRLRKIPVTDGAPAP